MTRLSKIRRDHVAAEFASLQAMISELGEDDLITRAGLEQRRDELAEELKEIQAVVNQRKLEDNFASAELVFSGRPVIASQGIETEFGGKIVSRFQDLVSKQYALETGGPLAARGAVPNKNAARLFISGVVRGSFGFRFEELGDQYEIDETSLKKAVDHSVGLIDAFAHFARKDFETFMENADQRVVDSAEKFFELIHDEQATFRAIADEIDKTFDEVEILRALDRARSTVVEDTEETTVGRLLGVLPESHQFEFVVEMPHRTIRGKVDRRISSDELEEYLKEYLNGDSVATLFVRRVKRRGELVRENFTLRGLAWPLA